MKQTNIIKEKSFDRLVNLQKMIKQESILRRLCKTLSIYNTN